MNKKTDFKPGRVDGKNSDYRSTSEHLPKALRYELVLIFKEHIEWGATKDKKVSQATIEKRKGDILGFFSDCYRLGLKIKSVKNLSQKHLIAVFHHLEENKQAPSSIQNKISTMRTFCNWIGKNGMVKDSTYYVKDPLSTKRTMVAQEDKSWEGHGIDVLEKLAEIEREDKMVAGVLYLCYGFGLRIREGVLMNLFKSEDNGSIKVIHGTKGGRARSVPIEHQWQMDLFKKLCEMTDQKTGRFLRRGKDAIASIKHIYYVMKKHKLTLAELGVSAHGLRHQYMHERFYELTGIQPQVKGGDISVLDKQEFENVTGKLMERAGHSRVSIGASYYGSRKMNFPLMEHKSESSVIGCIHLHYSFILDIR